MTMYNIIEYGDIYSKTSGSLWQYYRDEPALDNEKHIVNFTANGKKITGQEGDNETKDAEIMISIKYLSNFWRTL